MRDKLRRRYQVHKEVARKGYFEGEIALAELERLSELTPIEQRSPTGRNVALRFEFVRSDYDIPMLVVQLKTSLQLECQRCLGPLDWPLELDVRLLIDASDSLVRESSIDTLYSDDGFIDIGEVVEDELILAMPLVALHDDQSCNEHWQQAQADPESIDRENPFAVLKQLKTTE